MLGFYIKVQGLGFLYSRDLNVWGSGFRLRFLYSRDLNVWGSAFKVCCLAGSENGRTTFPGGVRKPLAKKGLGFSDVTESHGQEN